MTFARRAHAVFVAFILVTVAVTPFALRAQSAAPKPITLDDYPKFKRITGASISTDGKWMLYTVTPNEGDATLFVKSLDGDKVYDVLRGANASFSDNGRWVGYFIEPPASHGPGRARRRARRQHAGAGRRGGGGFRGRADAQVRTARPLERREDDVPVGGEFRLLARRRMAADPPAGRPGRAGRRRRGRRRGGRGGAGAAEAPAGPGTDLLMRHLATGTQRYVGKVGSYAFDEAGKLMAYTVRGDQRLGNGVYLMTLASGDQKTLDAADGRLRPAHVERGRRAPGGAARRQGEREDAARERDPHLAQRRDAADAGGHVRPGQGGVVPEGHGDQRVHRAALEQGRRPRARRPQGTGRREAGVHRPAGQRGRLALERRRPAVGADRADRAAAPGDEGRRARCRGGHAAPDRRRGDEDDHAHGRPGVGRRPHRHAVRRTGRVGRDQGRLLPRESRDGRAHAHRARALPDDGPVAGREVVRLPEGRPRLLVSARDRDEDRHRRRPQLRERRGRSRLREAGLRRGGLLVGREVGAAVRPVRRVGAAAGRRAAGVPHEGRRREAGGALPGGAARPRRRGRPRRRRPARRRPAGADRSREAAAAVGLRRVDEEVRLLGTAGRAVARRR